jgi:hypothetical protein
MSGLIANSSWGEIERDVLRYLSQFQQGCNAQYLRRPARSDAAGTRRLLYRLAKRGLTEPMAYKPGGRNVHWLITGAGRDALAAYDATIAELEGRS